MRKKCITSGKRDNYCVVLGKVLNDDGTAKPELCERLSKALTLFRCGKADRFIVCGGQSNPLSSRAEATVMKEYLVARGVDPDLIIEERESLTTLQNGKYAKRLLKDKPYDRLYLVTSSYHLGRWYLNPKRIFRNLYSLPVECVCSRDSNIDIFYGEDTPRLVVYKQKACFERFLQNNTGKHIIAKDITTCVLDGKERFFIECEEDLKRFVAGIEEVFGATELTILEEIYD